MGDKLIPIHGLFVFIERIDPGGGIIGSSTKVRVNCHKEFMKRFRLIEISALILATGLSSQAHALYCGQASIATHESAGRAYSTDSGYWWYSSTSYYATGSGENLGSSSYTSVILQETSSGYFEEVSYCPTEPTGDDGDSDGTADGDSDEPDFTLNTITMQGQYGVTMAGGSWLKDGIGSLSGYPSSDVRSSADSLQIPANSSVVKAFLYYGGSIALAGGDYTADDLDSAEDVANNAITFSVQGTTYTKLPDNSSMGSGNAVFSPDFGTLQGTTTTYWTNRVDVTDIIDDFTGDVSLIVQPPKLDLDANTSSSNGGNRAGDSKVNTCFGFGNWSLVVFYEDPTLETRKFIMKEGAVVAWDYVFAHKGKWLRPEVTFDHADAPMTEGTDIYILGQSGFKSGADVDNANLCACGCAGTYLLSSSGYLSASFWTSSHVDPTEFAQAYPELHRDRTNGPWYLQSTSSNSIAGNEYTKLISGDITTTYANLYEGTAVSSSTSYASNSIAATNSMEAMNGSDDFSTSNYGKHPWGGLGSVEYLATGTGLSAVKITPDSSVITEGATSTTLKFQGEGLDVFKPQARVNVGMIMLAIPVEGETPPSVDGDTDGSADGDDDIDPPAPVNTAPVVTLNGSSTVFLTEGDSFSDPGVSATDAEDGVLNTAVSGSVNTAVAGTYTLTYTATDSGGLSDSVSRTVIVEAAPPAATCEEYTATASSHESAGRAYSESATTGQTCFWGFCYGGTTTTTYYATGSGESMGTSGISTVTIYTEDDSTFHVGTCP